MLAGRGADLAEASMHALDWNARTLWEGRDAHRPGAEFEMIELVDGYRAFAPLASPPRAASWQRWLGGIDPESRDRDVFAERAEPRNGNTFAVASEQARIEAGLGGSGGSSSTGAVAMTSAGGSTPPARTGTPGEPMTYDLTVRKNLVLLLRRGYRGVHAGWIEDALERGGRFSLASQSVTGRSPFGGRSSQYLFVEATLACVLEHEARRHAARGDAPVGRCVRARGPFSPWNPRCRGSRWIPRATSATRSTLAHGTASTRTASSSCTRRSRRRCSPRPGTSPIPASTRRR